MSTTRACCLEHVTVGSDRRCHVEGRKAAISAAGRCKNTRSAAVNCSAANRTIASARALSPITAMSSDAVMSFVATRKPQQIRTAWRRWEAEVIAGLVRAEVRSAERPGICHVHASEFFPRASASDDPNRASTCHHGSHITHSNRVGMPLKTEIVGLPKPQVCGKSMLFNGLVDDAGKRQGSGRRPQWSRGRNNRRVIKRAAGGGKERVPWKKKELEGEDDSQRLVAMVSGKEEERGVGEHTPVNSKACTTGIKLVEWHGFEMSARVQCVAQHVAQKMHLEQLLTWLSGWRGHSAKDFTLVNLWGHGVNSFHRHSEEIRSNRRWVVLIGSTAIMAVMLLIGRATILAPQPSVALTEENLVFLEAWRTIDRAFIDKGFNGQSWFRYRENALKNVPMNSREQTYDAIRKMLATLNDPFTRFLEPERFKSLRTGTNGVVTGVGLEVAFDEHDDSRLVVVAPVAGGPADRAGIRAGDAILAIDNAQLRGINLYDAAQRLQGPDESDVSLTVQRTGENSPSTIILRRERVSLNPVSWRLCTVADGNEKIGYIKFSTFNSNSTAAVREAIERLKEGGATSYVLDIRNNSGGLFPSGIEIAKMWLEKGVIVYIVDTKGVRDIFETEGSGAIAPTEPLAILVNEGTASASEILAGALKDNGRAVILGERTFGKGKIQSVFELSDGSGMAVTVARYETPAHIDINKVGIQPDKPLPRSLPNDADGFCKCISDPSNKCGISAESLFSRK